MDHLEAFQQELQFLRNSVEEFTYAYPEISRELQLSAGRSGDPHVEQLLQSFAYLTGKLRADMELQRGETVNQMLHALYPNLIRSLPCMSVLQAHVETDGANFINGYTLKKGALMSAKACVQGNKKEHDCFMQCCYDTPLLPLRIEKTTLSPVNNFSHFEKRPDVRAVLAVKIESYAMDQLYEYPMDTLRFYIKDSSHRPFIYRALADKLSGIAVKVGNDIYDLKNDELTWLGFDDAHNVLPDEQSGQAAYRLLQEYFSFPDKFHFFEVHGIPKDKITQSFELLFLLDENNVKIKVPNDAFFLNSFPVINLYQKTFKPVQLEQTVHEYRLVADESQPELSEVHTISQVKSIGFDGRSKEVEPWLGGHKEQLTRLYYVSRLHPLVKPGKAGCDTMISLFDSEFKTSDQIDQTLMIKGWCSNRQLPEWFRVGSFLMPVGKSAMKFASVIEPPTNFKGADLDASKNVKLVSQLTLNQLSLGEGPDRLATLKQILRLYANPELKTHLKQIDGLVSMEARSKVKRLGEASWRGHCRGTLVTLKVDEDCFDAANPLLFGRVLSHFFALYTTLNHFVQLSLTSRQKKGEWKTWPPRIGEQIVA